MVLPTPHPQLVVELASNKLVTGYCSQSPVRQLHQHPEYDVVWRPKLPLLDGVRVELVCSLVFSSELLLTIYKWRNGERRRRVSRDIRFFIDTHHGHHGHLFIYDFVDYYIHRIDGCSLSSRYILLIIDTFLLPLVPEGKGKDAKPEIWHQSSDLFSYFESIPEFISMWIDRIYAKLMMCYPSLFGQLPAVSLTKTARHDFSLAISATISCDDEWGTETRDTSKKWWWGLGFFFFFKKI